MARKTLKELQAAEQDGASIRSVIFDDADGEVSYIKDAAEYGCVDGSCCGLIYFADTHAFYAKHAEEIDEILAELGDQEGEPFDIAGSMKRLGQSDLRNFLAWLAYEVRAQEIMRELEDEE